jgi:hypothetical protein
LADLVKARSVLLRNGGNIIAAVIKYTVSKCNEFCDYADSSVQTREIESPQGTLRVNLLTLETLRTIVQSRKPSRSPQEGSDLTLRGELGET